MSRPGSTARCLQREVRAAECGWPSACPVCVYVCVHVSVRCACVCWSTRVCRTTRDGDVACREPPAPGSVPAARTGVAWVQPRSSPPSGAADRAPEVGKGSEDARGYMCSWVTWAE